MHFIFNNRKFLNAFINSLFQSLCKSIVIEENFVMANEKVTRAGIGYQWLVLIMQYLDTVWGKYAFASENRFRFLTEFLTSGRGLDS